MKIRLSNIIILVLLSLPATCQLQPLLDQYSLNGLAINPAYAGSQEALSIGLNSRNQWIGFEGAPKTITFSAHFPMRDKKVNLGAILLNDRLGTRNETGFIVNYAYRTDLRSGKLSFGLAAGLSNIFTNKDLIRYNDHGDDLVLNPGVNTLLPEFSFGTYYYSDRLYIGLSIPLFLDHTFNNTTGNYRIGFHPEHINYMLVSGYIIRISGDFELLPTILLKTNPASNSQLDVNCNIIYKSKVWFGTSMRTNNHIGFLFQYQANDQLRIAYSYGHEFSELSSVQKGSHEIMLLYNFRYLVEVKSPRYF